MRFVEFPRATDIQPNNLFLIDGPDGTKTILASDLGLAGGGAIVRPIEFEILAEDWQSSVTYPEYAFQAMLPILGLVPEDLVRADFNLTSILASADAELAPAGDTMAGVAIFYAKKQPEVNVSGVITIFKAVMV